MITIYSFLTKLWMGDPENKQCLNLKITFLIKYFYWRYCIYKEALESRENKSFFFLFFKSYFVLSPDKFKELSFSYLLSLTSHIWQYQNITVLDRKTFFCFDWLQDAAIKQICFPSVNLYFKGLINLHICCTMHLKCNCMLFI